MVKLEADKAVAFDMDKPDKTNQLTNDLAEVFKDGVDVVLDYLWGDSALAIMTDIILLHILGFFQQTYYITTYR
ncbi:hypothetical protein [Companilactobacillus bobalius]|uniref:hypothetical protein n=1 Tax=Companilactobacillus bobalius TaxID=2801451 RepID=UPI001302CE11|nr:hypothetical protein [Companilactobacillus bobalius]KAE9560148.1 hypothetical protein ATN92_07940 [Companilactobacillus bobalius]